MNEKDIVDRIAKNVFIYGLCIVFIVLFIYQVYTGGQEMKQRSEFCNNYYPHTDNSYVRSIWSFRNVEDNYIKCCNYYLIDHEEIPECEIFGYSGK